jgi:predicted PhzF superfamily epimerase YddE/YHI9
MQKIAAENRHSETAFVVARADGDFDLRWCSPEVEDDLCGHATLAAAMYWYCVNTSRGRFAFGLAVAFLTVSRDRDWFDMDFPSRPPMPCELPAELLPALGLKSAHVMRARDYLVVVDHADQVRSLTPDIAALSKLDIGIGGIIVTAAGENGVDYVRRFSPPSVGIDEDPATGSIQCTLTPY